MFIFDCVRVSSIGTSDFRSDERRLESRKTGHGKQEMEKQNPGNGRHDPEFSKPRRTRTPLIDCAGILEKWNLLLVCTVCSCIGGESQRTRGRDLPWDLRMKHFHIYLN